MKCKIKGGTRSGETLLFNDNVKDTILVGKNETPHMLHEVYKLENGEMVFQKSIVSKMLIADKKELKTHIEDVEESPVRFYGGPFNERTGIKFHIVNNNAVIRTKSALFLYKPTNSKRIFTYAKTIALRGFSS